VRLLDWIVLGPADKSMSDGDVLREWFDNCRADLEEAAEQWRQTASTALEAAHAAADSMRFASRLYHAKRALDRMQRFLPKRFVELLQLSMAERFTREVSPFRGATLCDDMGLVDDEVVNESIEVSRIAARVQLNAEWQIREAQEGLALRLGHEVGGERTSPLHPEAFACAVWRLTEEMSLNAEERAACLRVAPEAIVDFARMACASAVAWFGRGDVTASFVVKRSTSSHTAVVIPIDVLLGEQVPDADRRESDFRDGAATPPPAQDASPLDARDHVFRGVIAGIDAVLCDFRLTPELKRVLSALQMVVVRFAFGSPETLYSPEHRLWSVSRKLAHYALTNCLRDRVAHDDFILFADHTIQALLPLDMKSLVGISSHLDAIDDFVRSRPQQLIENEKSAMQHLVRLQDRRREMLGVAMTRHRERISTAMGHTDMPFRLRQFMLADWAEVLARTELSEGQDSEAYAEYWEAAERVIARLRVGGSTELTSDHPSEIGPLLEVLDRGMASIAVPSVEKHELASAFLRPGAPARADWQDSDLHIDALAGADIQPVRKDGTFWGAREHLADWSATTAGLTTAIPAGDAEHWVNTLRIGTVIELFLLGTWFEARVASINGAGNLFMFKDELGEGSHPLTRRALLRLVREGLAGPL